jgi:hypothetical protein
MRKSLHWAGAAGGLSPQTTPLFTQAGAHLCPRLRGGAPHSQLCQGPDHHTLPKHHHPPQRTAQNHTKTQSAPSTDEAKPSG